MTMEAEQAVLGGIMLKPEAYYLVSDILTTGDFQRAQHRTLFHAFGLMHKISQPLDAITVNQFLRENDKDVAAGGLEYLIDLVSNTPSAANIRAWAEIVQKTSERNRLTIAAASILSCGSFEEAVKILADVRPRQASRLLTAKDGSKLMWEAIVQRYDAVEGLIGESTTIDGLDVMTGGFEKAKVHWIAARPSMGKTAYAVQLAIRSKRCLFFSLEMSAASLIERAAANIGKFPYRWLRFPKEAEASPLWDGVLSKTIQEVNSLKLVIDDASLLTVEDICARARQAHMVEPLTMLIIDHFGCMKFPGKNSNVIELGDASKVIKALAKDLDIPIIVLYQLNRAVTERAGNEPTMADLRGSGQLEEDADSIILLHRPEYYKQEPKGYIKFIVAKARDGEVGEAWALSRLSHMRLEPCNPPTGGESQPSSYSRGGFSK